MSAALGLAPAAQVISGGHLCCADHRRPLAVSDAVWLTPWSVLATVVPCCDHDPLTWIVDLTTTLRCVATARTTGKQCRRPARPGTARCPVHQTAVPR